LPHQRIDFRDLVVPESTTVTIAASVHYPQWSPFAGATPVRHINFAWVVVASTAICQNVHGRACTVRRVRIPPLASGAQLTTI
jgi:hypothetical protein